MDREIFIDVVRIFLRIKVYVEFVDVLIEVCVKFGMYLVYLYWKFLMLEIWVYLVILVIGCYLGFLRYYIVWNK